LPEQLDIYTQRHLVLIRAIEKGTSSLVIHSTNWSDWICLK